MRSQVSGVPPGLPVGVERGSPKVWFMRSTMEVLLTAVPGAPPPGAAMSTELEPQFEKEARLSCEVLAPTQIRFAPA